MAIGEAPKLTESLCPREHVHLDKCSEVNAGNSPKFSKILEKFGEIWTLFGEVWRSLEKFGEKQLCPIHFGVLKGLQFSPTIKQYGYLHI
jgi:hypothetical protein